MANIIVSFSSKYGVNARKATIFGILGGLCLWIYVSKIRPRLSPRDKPKSSGDVRSCLLAKIHGGDLVLQRLEESIKEAKANPATLANIDNLLKALLEQEHLDLMKLQEMVAKLEMSGREDSAVKILTKAAEKAHATEKPHEAYEIEMLLVEMFIYKGKFEKALECNCLKDESIKDSRRPLYKAIIYQLLGDTKKAKEYWKEFIKEQHPSLNETSQDFKEFGEKVDQLQIAIQGNARRK